MDIKQQNTETIYSHPDKLKCISAINIINIINLHLVSDRP